MSAARASADLREPGQGRGLVCPHCHGALSGSYAELACVGCERTFSSQAGIPDLRVFPDPYLSFDEDRARTEKVLTVPTGMPLPDVLRHYWSFSDITPPALREQFVASALRAEDRGQRLLELLASLPEIPRQVPGRRVLEIGSGTGGFLVQAASRFEEVVGLDIAMRWLHLSRRRFLDRGLPEPALVCACAEHLPFPDRRFDLIVIALTLEFVREPGRVLAEAARTLAPGGAVLLHTVNRYSLAVEPHVNLWGVGFLPRTWQETYVRRRRGVGYTLIRPLSYSELKRLASRHFRSCVVRPADVPDTVLAGLPVRTRVLVRVYRRLKQFPPMARLLRWLGPEWEVVLCQ